MHPEKLFADATALPQSGRVALAQALWKSIDADLPDADEQAAIAEAVRRDTDLTSGRVTAARMKKSCRRRGEPSN